MMLAKPSSVGIAEVSTSISTPSCTRQKLASEHGLQKAAIFKQKESLVSKEIYTVSKFGVACNGFWTISDDEVFIM